MSRFNTNKPTSRTTNRASSAAYAQTDKLALASLLLTSFLKDKYYTTGKQDQTRLAELTKKVDPLFAAKAAVYARNVFGMRSVSHVVAGELTGALSGLEWAKNFYQKVVFRPDDALEILSYVNGKPSHAMAKGLRAALEGFDDYQIGKYKGEKKSLKLVDAVNIVHAHSPSIEKLVKGTLKAPETFETKLSAAGKKDNKDEAKAEAWRELLENRKIGYLALVRNLRNIAEQAPELIDTACNLLVDEALVKKSKIFPFQYLVAYNEVKHVRKFVQAISRAMDIACANVPKFDGKTLIVTDLSASMTSGGNPVPAEIAALFGASMFKSNDADVIKFGTYAKRWSGNPDDSTMSLGISLEANNGVGHGTDMSAPMSLVLQEGAKYDRIFVFSDMQTWMDGYYGRSVKDLFRQYTRDVSPDCKLYSFDLSGYGDMQFPEQNVYCVAGWSDKAFDVIAKLEDGKSLVEQIEQVEL